MTEKERAYVIRLLEEANTTEDRIVWQTIHEVDYIRTPPTPEQFLDDDYYMHTIAKDLFPYWREAFLECVNPHNQVKTVIATGPIGAGKTVFSLLVFLYKIACTACLRDPQQFYHQMVAATLTYGIFAVTKDNVSLGSYKKCISFLKCSPFFKEIYNVREDKEYKGLLVDFPGGVNLVAGSNELHALSQDLISCVDEDTTITTKEYGDVCIKDVEGIPCTVLSRDENNKTCYQECDGAIYRGERECFEIELESGEVIWATEDHLFLVRRGKDVKYEWVRLDELTEIDDAVGLDQTTRIKSIRKIGKRRVYDLLNVSKTNCFVANKTFIVHNCLLEEVNFRREKDPVKAAYDLLNATERRIESRYMREGGFIPGVVIINSSKKYQTDFLDDYINKVGSNNDVRVYDAPIWHVKGVFPGIESVSDNQVRFCGKMFKVDQGSDTRDPKIIEDGEDIPDDVEVLEVPVEYKARFELDLMGSLQDIAGVSTSRLKRLFTSVAEYRRCYDSSIPNPITKQDIPMVLMSGHNLQDFFDFNSYFIRRHSTWQPRDNPGASRYAHVDLSRNNDATGIGVCHISNFRGVDVVTHEGVPVNIVLPVVRIDFALRIISPDGTRIDYSKIRAFFAWLHSHGVQFKLITFDDYQSTDAQNILTKMGFTTGMLSLDRKARGEQAAMKHKSPYIVWKNAVLEGRVQQFPYPYMEKEALHLINYDEKIDHPDKFRDGSKGCFVGDTTVNLLDGRALSFESLTKEFSDPNEVFYVYSVDNDNNIVVGEAYHPRITKYVTKLVEITLDNGRQMRCTMDHLWMNRDGTYIEAKDLEAGTSLMPFYRKVESSTSVRIISLSEPVPVYDLTVKKYSNFCIGSSVFVHNSKDLTDGIAGSVYNCLMDQKEIPHDEVEMMQMAQQKYQAQDSMATVMGSDKAVAKEKMAGLNSWILRDHNAELEELDSDADDDVLVIDQTKE